MTPSHPYPEPPLVEAVADFAFEPSEPWDLTIPGLLFSEVKARYPNKREQKNFSFEVHPAQGNVRSSPVSVRLQYLSSDEKSLIQVGENWLGVNKLKPYGTWDAFREQIGHALGVYEKVARPERVNAMSLRYINRIAIPGTEVEIERYIRSEPKVPDELPQVFANWALRTDIPFEAKAGVLILNAGSKRSEASAAEISFLLDLRFVSFATKQPSPSEAMDWMVGAHEVIESAFEACITDESRKLFGRD